MATLSTGQKVKPVLGYESNKSPSAKFDKVNLRSSWGYDVIAKGLISTKPKDRTMENTKLISI